MSRFLGGMLAGVVVVAAMGAVLSLTTPLTRSPDVSSEVPAAEAPAQNGSDSQVNQRGADADLVEIAPHAPKDGEAAADSITALDAASTQPSDRPSVGEVAGQLTKPEAATDPGIEVAAVAPIAPSAPTALPSSPQEDVLPEVVDSDPARPSVAEEKADSTEGAQGGEVSEQTEPAEQDAPQVAAPAEPGAEELGEPTAEAPEEPEQAESLPRIAALPQIGGGETSGAGSVVGKPVVPLTERDKKPDVEAQPFVEPIKAYAAEFDNPEGKSLMSIVLIDDRDSFGVEALQDFPYPLSFAINPTDPNAAEKLARHRAAGFEVLLIADLPETASAQDAEVSLAVWLEKLPETVGIIEGTGTGIQGNRKLAEHVASIAGATGRGLVMQGNGLNTVQKMAARKGVPSAVIFRDFDGAGQDPHKMRRFLDQAAFRAGQEGAVVMLGRVRPETISALVQWGHEDKSERVAVAPISAVLLKDQQK